ncbi:MAG: GNAT family N-acetyltransferase, partial [Acidimicrobiia bacterium]|nr:GNAT family N-acetyltransferase [Acidimicrobiia bacterium]
DIVVDPAERGKGAGTELTAAMLAWAASQGAERSYLQVVATNEAAIGMYDRLGFTDTYHYAYRTEG